ncbi:hypothetical protein FEM48_Zijuj07G0141700 [Ziziphus jujuba var. spinosa]|uniref:Uncharacterized protein n=1 Tax=Ziziphus jujuba var. spinosa TaxID=714518 RepID=A0A978V533_ZIZJJ|nr:hypothetical protein FEM48_Zijuj07G0141700 [Ziziphus jujuba var. spinosa]
MLEHIFELWFGLMVFLILTFGIFDGSITKMMMGGNETINQVLYRVDVGHRWVTYERAFPTFENCRKGNDFNNFDFIFLEERGFIQDFASNLFKASKADDNDARLALDPHNKYKIQTKPHDHGDVHSLLYSGGLRSS